MKNRTRGQLMGGIEFGSKHVSDYAVFTRGITRNHAQDIQSFVDESYNCGRYRQAPFVQANPNFKTMGITENLVVAGGLRAECAHIFRAGKTSAPSVSLTHFKLQGEAISLAQSGERFVRTIGIGSGKSLAYFILAIGCPPRRADSRRTLFYILDPADMMGEDYPAEAFRVFKNNEMRDFGKYRTRRLVLQVSGAMVPDWSARVAT